MSSSNPPEVDGHCPLPIIRRGWAEDGSDEYTDVIERCAGELYVERTTHSYEDIDGWAGEATYWVVKCKEGNHTLLTPYDDTNGPTVPADEIDASKIIAQVLDYITSIIGKESQ